MESNYGDARAASLDLLPAQDCTWGDSPTWSRAGWAVVRIAMLGLLATYLVGWAQDLQRLSRLEAEPSPPLIKIISKHEAWLRIRKIHHEAVNFPDKFIKKKGLPS
jgi:hypothetical protein